MSENKKIDCERCDATGETECVVCDGNCTVMCSSCMRSGTGSSEVLCDACDAVGEVDCEHCDGDGRVECPDCGGFCQVDNPDYKPKEERVSPRPETRKPDTSEPKRITIRIVDHAPHGLGGREISSGRWSGEWFRDTHLVPALQSNDVVTVDLAGAPGYPVSTLEEVFGGLVRVMGTGIMDRVKLICSENLYWDDAGRARQFMWEEAERQGEDGGNGSTGEIVPQFDRSRAMNVVQAVQAEADRQGVSVLELEEITPQEPTTEAEAKRKGDTLEVVARVKGDLVVSGVPGLGGGADDLFDFNGEADGAPEESLVDIAKNMQAALTLTTIVTHYPDLTLGQILVNALGLGITGAELWNMSDDQLLEDLEDWVDNPTAYPPIPKSEPEAEEDGEAQAEAGQ